MKALRVLYRHLRVFSRTWLSNTVLNVLEPVLYLSALGYGLGAFVQEIEGMSYIQFIAPGMIGLSAMYAATFECTYGTFIRLYFEKTLPAMLAAPVTALDIVLGEIFYGAIKSVVFGVIILAVTAALGLVRSPLALAIPLVLVPSGLVFSALAVWYTTVVTNIDYLNYSIPMVILPFFLFGGLYFPVSSLPAWLQAANWANPLYHTVEVCRALVLGQAPAGLWPHILALAVMAAVIFPFPLKRMEKKLLS
jgi:lipooligosaccharide transport system permease protein